MAPKQCLVLVEKLRLQSYNLMWKPQIFSEYKILYKIKYGWE